ncbi:MAG TPA: hypothetical protein VGJ84_14750 [Polyangiaceae bacterium]
MRKTPLSLVKERFDTKEKLVNAIKDLATDTMWIDRVNQVKGLARVSNAKLLRIHRVLTETKQRFGSRAKLVSAIAEVEKRASDLGFIRRLERYPLPRLLDLHRTTERRKRRAEAGAGKPASKS